MAMSLDFPGLVFKQAKGFNAGRPDGPPLWIVWHDMEVDELPDRAENTAGYFANPADGRDVSAHWNVDNNSAVQSVREQDVAWAVGNRPGNNRGISIELAGRARQTRDQWLDPYGLAMFVVAARVAAKAMQRWQIPNRWCSLTDLRERIPGHTTHRDLAVVYGGSDHTDPGVGFPRDHVLTVVGQALRGDPVTQTPSPADPSKTVLDWVQYSGETMSWRLDALAWMQPKVRGGPEKGQELPLITTVTTLTSGLAQLGRDVAALTARPQVEAAPVDPAVLQAAVREALMQPEVMAAYAKAAADETYRRQES